MKKRDLTRKLKTYSFEHIRTGKHEIWSNGFLEVAVPKGREINKYTAKSILNSAKKAAEFKKKGGKL